MNTNKILLFLFFLFYLQQGNAQVDTLAIQTKHTIIISLSAGVALPVGAFSYFETDPEKYTENIAGPAQAGFNGRLEIVYMLSKNFGINGILISSANNAAKIDSADLFYDPCPYCHGLGGGSVRLSYNYATKTWYINNILTGIIFMIENENTKLHFKLAGGVQQTLSPESKLNEKGYGYIINSPVNYPYDLTTIQPQLKSYNFVLDAGMDFKISLKKKWGIIFNWDYLFSHSEFSGQSSYSNTYENGSNQTIINGTKQITFKKNISLFYFNVGLSYELK